MPTIYEGLGTEKLVDKIVDVMRLKLNDALSYQQEIGNSYDIARAEEFELEPDTIALELVQPQNFHAGILPSFIQNNDRVENYPLVAVVPGRTAPDPEDAAADQYSVLQNAISIHSFARANPKEGENVAYRRAMRMAEAVHQVITTDNQVRRYVEGVSGPQVVDRSEPYFFPAGDGHGEDWCWFAVMHMYQVKNYSIAPQEV
jgi:hypothetical protein